MEIKIGDSVLVTTSTLRDDLAGQILKVIRIHSSDDLDKYPLVVESKYGTTRWANGILATELIKALA